MTLCELSGEYLKEEEKLTRQIRSFIPVVESLSGEERHTAQRRLLCLYEMRREVQSTAYLLAHYYDACAQRRHYRKG